MFYITPRTNSGIELPDLDVTDQKLLSKYGSNLTANFADIRAFGAKAFFQKKNLSNGAVYSLCACATGYIWISIRSIHESSKPAVHTAWEVQVGTYALKAKTITTVEIPFWYWYTGGNDPIDPFDGHLALLCSTVLGKYLRLRMVGQQYEYATETAITQSLREVPSLGTSLPCKIGPKNSLETLLCEVCTNAPLPPTSDVSLISRSMITGRWQIWREQSILRKRYFLSHRLIRCFRRPRRDSIDLLSNCFRNLAPSK